MGAVALIDVKAAGGAPNWIEQRHTEEKWPLYGASPSGRRSRRAAQPLTRSQGERGVNLTRGSPMLTLAHLRSGRHHPTGAG